MTTKTNEERNPEADPFNGFEIPPNTRYFDIIERRFFVNILNRPIKINFSHDARRIEIITIGEKDTKDPALTALEGETIEEED